MIRRQDIKILNGKYIYIKSIYMKLLIFDNKYIEKFLLHSYIL